MDDKNMDTHGARPEGPGSREWRRLLISPYRSYEASSDGDIRRDGRELKGVRDTHGYLTVRLYYAGLSRRFKVHRLVCEAFHGAPPEGADTAHLDGNRTNNAASNLAWVSRKENMAHKHMHGTAQKGERGPGAKLSQDQVDEIRRREAAGESRPRLAEEFGIARGHLRRIVVGEAW